MTTRTHLTDADRAAIAAAVSAAEAKTDGEIVCILAPEADDYAEVPVAWAAAAALIAPFGAVLAGFRPDQHLPWLAGWEAGAPSPTVLAFEAVTAFVTVQAATFALVFLLLQLKALRRALTPGPLKRSKVRKAAASQFLATGLSAAPDRTGVLIYASLGDRMVEVVADRLIDAKVGEAPWAQAVKAVQAGMHSGVEGGGFVAAVEVCGAALTQHFPPTGPRANAFSDEVREL